MIAGGWEFIIAAYALTWIVFGAYSVSLWIRLRKVREEEKTH